MFKINKERLVFDIVNKENNSTMINVACIVGESVEVTYMIDKEKVKALIPHFDNIETLFDMLADIFMMETINDNDKSAIQDIMRVIEYTYNLKINITDSTIYGIEYLTELDSNSMIHIDMNLPPMFIQPYENIPGMLSGFISTNDNTRKKDDKISTSPRKSKTNLTFEDVVGMEEVKDKLNDVIRQFKQAEKFKAWNIKPIKGILLYGPSGTGKSYIAEAFANEIDAEFFPLSSADIMSKYLGESGKAIRAKFEEARMHELSLIYIDEVDSIATKRDGGENNKERNATLNELLVQMASPENDNIVMVFATNMLDLLDPAFLRSGRCDFKIEVSLPDFKARKGILELNSKGRPLADDVDFDKIARNMSGMNCADMSHVANEAARLALKEDKDVIEMHDFEKALEEMICGPKSKNKALTDKEKEITAIHETGHLFVNEFYKVNKTKKISILPRGSALGFVLYANEDEDDKFLQSKTEMLNMINVLLAGRAAEELFFGEITTGASNDLEKANKLATAMVCKYGFVKELGLSTFNTNNPMTINLIQKHIDEILNECYATTMEILQSNKSSMKRFAEILKLREEMDGEEIAGILYSAQNMC